MVDAKPLPMEAASCREAVFLLGAFANTPTHNTEHERERRIREAYFAITYFLQVIRWTSTLNQTIHSASLA